MYIDELSKTLPGMQSDGSLMSQCFHNKSCCERVVCKYLKNTNFSTGPINRSDSIHIAKRYDLIPVKIICGLGGVCFRECVPKVVRNTCISNLLIVLKDL